MKTVEASPSLGLGLETAELLDGPAEVRNRFDGRWVSGFRVAGIVAGTDGVCYRVVRCSDGAVLPVVFAPADVRREQ